MKIYIGTEHVVSVIVQRLLHEVLGCATVIILMIFFCKAKIFPLLEELLQKIIPYFITQWKQAQ